MREGTGNAAGLVRRDGRKDVIRGLAVSAVLRRAAWLFLAGAASAAPASAASAVQPPPPPPGYDDPATLTLVRKAREMRARAGFDHSTVQSYRAGAEGHIYFFLDREDGGAPIPMRVDQVAVDLYGDALGRTRQIVRGLRRQELLPIRDFRYYVDRLTAVQNGFGNRIEIGRGRDVRGVPHPLGSDGELAYHFRIADSIRVAVPSLGDPLRVYEVEVRPRREEAPAMAGSVFLDAATGALVRMTFGFTPASYVDPRNDRVTVRLEHSLWENSLWLPYRQIVEVRREMPGLDLPVGSVIRATLEVAEYDFNPELPPGFFAGPELTLRPYGVADSAAFRAGLMDRMADEGLSPVSWQEVEAEARRVARDRLTSGLPRTRFYADQLSSVLRASRAEGVRFGLGASFAPDPSVRVSVLPGFGTADRALDGSVRVEWTAVGVAAAAHHRRLHDAGPFAAASGFVNTMSTLLQGRDHTDPWFATGGALAAELAVGAQTDLRVEGAWEEMSAPSSLATFGREEPWRGLRPVDEGGLARLEAQAARRWGGAGARGEAVLTGAVGRWAGSAHGSIEARAGVRAAPSDLLRRLSVTVAAGRLWGEAPRQLHYLLGGRGTLPGHAFRAFGGRAFGLARAEVAVTLLPGWVTGRLIAGGGAVGDTPGRLAESWEVESSRGLLGYAGLGVGLLQDIARVDGAWGIPGGAFQLIFSVDPQLRPFL